MENKINLVDILKECPSGMGLDCPLFENLEFDRIDIDDVAYPIKCIVKTDMGFRNVHTFTKYGCYSTEKYAKCAIFPKGKTTWEGFVPPYQFKDGDIIYNQCIKATAIFYKQTNDNTISHCFLNAWKKLKIQHKHCKLLYDWRLATEEEKQKLFKAIKDNGYRWNAETKTLEELIEPKFKVGDRIRKENNNSRVYTINGVYSSMYGVEGRDFGILIEEQDEWELVPNKFDISNLKPFDRVLVRLTNNCVWIPKLFYYYDTDSKVKYYPFVTTDNTGYVQCIPYKGNEHLCRTTNDCDDFYKTWE